MSTYLTTLLCTQAGKPVAKLVPFDLNSEPRQLGAGQWKGKIWMADDFDELPEETLQLFTGKAGESD